MKVIWLILCTTAVFLSPVLAPAADTNQPPLPALEELFERILERARLEGANDRAFATNYVFIRTRNTEYRNSKDVVKKRVIKVRTNNPAAIIAAAAASPPATAREKPGRRGADKPMAELRGKPYEQEEFMLNGELARRFDFTLAGRELVNGRPAFIVEFQPKPGKLPERNLRDKFINKAAGRIWFDEMDYAAAKAEIWLTERVNVIGGLVGAVWKFNFHFERERLADGVWFTRRSNWHLEGRELFVRRTVDFHEERTDVRRHEAHLESAAAALSP